MYSTTYQAHYNSISSEMGFVLETLAERPGKVCEITVTQAGAEGLQALLDAVADQGHRVALIKLIDAPTLPGWAREQIETFLYGTSKQRPALFGGTRH